MGSSYSAALPVKGPQLQGTRRLLGFEHQQVILRGKQSRGHKEPLDFTSWCRTDPTGLTRCQLCTVGTFPGAKRITVVCVCVGGIIVGSVSCCCSLPLLWRQEQDLRTCLYPSLYELEGGQGGGWISRSPQEGILSLLPSL